MTKPGIFGPRMLGPHLINGAPGIALGGPGLPVALVDAEDYASLSQHTWRVMLTPHTRYAIRSVGRRIELMHRVIARPAVGFSVDHINRDGLDNRALNLRSCRPLQNSANMRKCHFLRVSSQYKGVGWSKGKVRARCAEKHLGTFLTEEDAARAYDDAARARWGAFARLNFPRAGEQPALIDDAA